MTPPADKPNHRSQVHQIRELEVQVAGLQGAYQRACNTIGEMHAAAVGEVRAPVRGVVEDVHDARLAWSERADRLSTLVASISYEHTKLAAQMAEDQTFYAKRIDQLLELLHAAGIEDPEVPEIERKTIVPGEHFDALAQEVAGE